MDNPNKTINDTNKNISSSENDIPLTGNTTVNPPPNIDKGKISAAQKMQKLDSTMSIFSRISSAFYQIINVFRFFKTII